MELASWLQKVMVGTHFMVTGECSSLLGILLLFFCYFIFSWWIPAQTSLLKKFIDCGCSILDSVVFVGLILIYSLLNFIWLEACTLCMYFCVLYIIFSNIYNMCSMIIRKILIWQKHMIIKKLDKLVCLCH